MDQVKGLIFNENGTGGLSSTELEKKSVYTKNLNKYWSEVVFAFPGVKVGSIIEYTYRSTMQSYGGLDDWQFQEELPIMKSKYSVVMVPTYEFVYNVQKSPDYPVKIDQNKFVGKVTFEMNDLPGLAEEPFMDARKDYVQRVVFQLRSLGGASGKRYMTTWPEMIRELLQEQKLGGQIGKSLTDTEVFLKEVKLDPSKTSRLIKVYNFVRDQMDWNGFSGIYSADGIKTAWSKKTGHSGEINLILASMLREADIDASAMLVSERSNGRVNPQYPFLEQFNRVFVYAMVDGKKYYMNAVDKNNPAHIIPSSILNTTALIVNRKTGGLVEIQDDNFAYRDYINVAANLNTDGRIEGRTFISSTDYARTRRLSAYHSSSEAYIKRFSRAESIEIDSFALENENIDTLPLQQKFTFKTGLNTTGDYFMVPLSLFTELNGNPFLNQTRFSTVNFGYRQSLNFNFSLHVPENLTVDALPKSIRVINEDKSISFQRTVAFDDKSRTLITRITVAFTKSQYSVDEYPGLQEFYKKMYDLLEEQIVLKKS